MSLSIAELKDTVTVVVPALALGSTKIAEVSSEPLSVTTTAGEEGQLFPRSSLMRGRPSRLDPVGDAEDQDVARADGVGEGEAEVVGGEPPADDVGRRGDVLHQRRLARAVRCRSSPPRWSPPRSPTVPEPLLTVQVWVGPLGWVEHRHRVGAASGERGGEGEAAVGR